MIRFQQTEYPADRFDPLALMPGGDDEEDEDEDFEEDEDQGVFA